MQDFSENFNSLFGNTIKWKPKQMLTDSGSIGKDYHSESAFKIWKKKKFSFSIILRLHLVLCKSNSECKINVGKTEFM